MIAVVALTATLAASSAPGPGLVDAVRMASAVQWNAGHTWNTALAAGELTKRPQLPSPAATTTRRTSLSLAAIRNCESGNDYGAVSANGQYRGAYQFSRQTWESVGGTGDPAAASPLEQDARAQILYNRNGPAPWPVCGR